MTCSAGAWITWPRPRVRARSRTLRSKGCPACASSSSPTWLAKGCPRTPTISYHHREPTRGSILVARALLSPGDTLLVDAATYAGAISAFSLAGARLVAVPSDAEGPDMAALERLSRAGAKAFYSMPNCNNPTGAEISTARRQALVAWSVRSGTPLIEDDYGADLFLDPEPPPARSVLSRVTSFTSGPSARSWCLRCASGSSFVRARCDPRSSR